MTHDNPQLAGRLARERAVICYLSALDSKDSDALAAVLHEAQSDPLLMQMIDEVNQACIIEDSALEALQTRPRSAQLRPSRPVEHHLTIEFRVQENPMNTIATLPARETAPAKKTPLSLTMLATVAAVTLISVAMLVLSSAGRPERPTAGAAAGQQASATPTATPTTVSPTLVPIQIAPGVHFPTETNLQINGFVLKTIVAGVQNIQTAPDGSVTITLDRALMPVLVYQLVADVLRFNLQPAVVTQFQLFQPGQTPLVVQIVPLSTAGMPATDGRRTIIIGQDPAMGWPLVVDEVIASLVTEAALVESQPLYIEFALPDRPRLVIYVPQVSNEMFTLAAVTWGNVEATVVFIEGNVENTIATTRAEVEATVAAIQTRAAGLEGTARASLPLLATAIAIPMATGVLPPTLAPQVVVPTVIIPTLPPLPTLPRGCYELW